MKLSNFDGKYILFVGKFEISLELLILQKHYLLGGNQ